MAAKSELKQQMETSTNERGGLGGVCMHIFVCGHMDIHIYTIYIYIEHVYKHTLLCIYIYVYIYSIYKFAVAFYLA